MAWFVKANTHARLCALKVSGHVLDEVSDGRHFTPIMLCTAMRRHAHVRHSGYCVAASAKPSSDSELLTKP